MSGDNNQDAFFSFHKLWWWFVYTAMMVGTAVLATSLLASWRGLSYQPFTVTASK